MSLLTAGYWPTTYWASSYWADDYWPDYGTEVVAILPTFIFVWPYKPETVRDIEFEGIEREITFRNLR